MSQKPEHGPWDLFECVAANRDVGGPGGGEPASYQTPADAPSIVAVRVYQTSDHVDGVQVRYRGEDAFVGTFGRSGKETRPVTLELGEHETIISVKVVFANEMLWAQTFAFTTNTGRVVDSGDARRELLGARLPTSVVEPNAPHVIMANNGAPLTGFKEEVGVEIENVPELGELGFPGTLPMMGHKVWFLFSDARPPAAPYHLLQRAADLIGADVEAVREFAGGVGYFFDDASPPAELAD